VLYQEDPQWAWLGAANGTALTAMIGGDQQILHWSKPILETFARNIVYIGPPGTGHAVKVINNALQLVWQLIIWCQCW